VNARFGSESVLRLNRLFCLLGAALLALALAGCKQGARGVADVEPSPFVSIVANENALATPAEASKAVDPLTSPLPTPETSDAPLLERDPTPAPGMATVRGELVLDGKPATENTLYLAPIIYAGEEGGIAALDAVNDPRTEPDRSGYFHFTNVEPGRYALGISSPSGAVLIKRGDTEITLDATEDQIVDLGTVRIVPFN
jgi:hypothetical protein